MIVVLQRKRFESSQPHVPGRAVTKMTSSRRRDRPKPDAGRRSSPPQRRRSPPGSQCRECVLRFDFPVAFRVVLRREYKSGLSCRRFAWCPQSSGGCVLKTTSKKTLKSPRWLALVAFSLLHLNIAPCCCQTTTAYAGASACCATSTHSASHGLDKQGCLPRLCHHCRCPSGSFEAIGAKSATVSKFFGADSRFLPDLNLEPLSPVEESSRLVRTTVRFFPPDCHSGAERCIRLCRFNC